MLLCPKCRSSLKREKNRYVCPHGHSYDIARQGYTHLIIHSQKEGGDNKEMRGIIQRLLPAAVKKHMLST